MIKYILAGGYVSKAKDEGKAFVEELVKDVDKKQPRILDCLFAQPEELWQEKFESDIEYFSRFIPSFEFELANEDTFTEQVKNADVVFFRGGDTELLLNMLNKFPDWQNHFSGKVIAGTSAGAEILSSCSYNLDYLYIMDGIGMLPIKFIPHWKSDYNAPNVDWDKALNELKNYGEDLKIIALKEGEFKVLYKDNE